MLKNNKAITLIALIITIIVLLILAGVVINMTLGNDGIISKTQGATDKYKESAIKEQLELEIVNLKLNMYSDNTQSIATLNDLKSHLENPKFNGDYEVELMYEPLEGTGPTSEVPLYAKVTNIPAKFMFYVDEKLVVIGENKISDTSNKKPEGLVDYWKFNGSLNNEISGKNKLKIYRGIPEYQEDGSVYLNDAILSTDGNYSLSSSFTIELQAKIVEAFPCHDNNNPFLGVGQTDAFVGETCVALWWGNNGYFAITNGLGDEYTKTESEGNSSNNTWYTLVLRYNGTKLELFKNGQKVIGINGISLKNTPLYIGGLPTNHPTHFGNSAVKGYFKNLCIYNRALSDEEIANLK